MINLVAYHHDNLSSVFGLTGLVVLMEFAIIIAQEGVHMRLV